MELHSERKLSCSTLGAMKTITTALLTAPKTPTKAVPRTLPQLQLRLTARERGRPRRARRGPPASGPPWKSVDLVINV